MKGFFTRLSPVMVAGLTGLWMLLNQTVAPAQILLGAGIALILTWASSTLRPLHARVRRLDVVAALLFVVLRDIVYSNVAVARIVLGLARSGDVRPGFLRIPLDLRDPHGLAGLAAIVTSTPGTVWVNLSADGRQLTLHVLDLDDEARWIRIIKERYESRLMRIFE
jgi:multicomponent K+:H+ antiporter subunit E